MHHLVLIMMMCRIGSVQYPCVELCHLSLSDAGELHDLNAQTCNVILAAGHFKCKYRLNVTFHVLDRKPLK